MRSREGFNGLFAARPFTEGEAILALEGELASRPSTFSVQLAANAHLEVPPGADPLEDARFHWRFLNHSCDPNSYVRAEDRTLRALRPVSRGEELTFNYLTTESRLATPFECRCGSAGCFGQIRGFSFLTREQQLALEPARAAHLGELAGA